MNLDEIRKHMTARDRIALVRRPEEKDLIYMVLADDVPDLVAELESVTFQLSAMGIHAAALRVCLLKYGNHFDKCAVFPRPSGKDCDCGFEANVNRVPGDPTDADRLVERLQKIEAAARAVDVQWRLACTYDTHEIMELRKLLTPEVKRTHETKCFLCGEVAVGKVGAEPRCEAHA